MKKNFLVFLLLASILLLYSCKKGFDRALVDDSDKKTDDRMEQLIEVIKSQDKDALKAMFSKQALSEADDFDRNLNALFKVKSNLGKEQVVEALVLKKKMLVVPGITKKKPNQHIFLRPVNKNIMLQYMSIQ